MCHIRRVGRPTLRWDTSFTTCVQNFYDITEPRVSFVRLVLRTAQLTIGRMQDVVYLSRLIGRLQRVMATLGHCLPMNACIEWASPILLQVALALCWAFPPWAE